MSINDFDLIKCEFPPFPDNFPVDPPILTPSFADLTTLNTLLEGLRIDTHIQSLRIKVERAKRQRMRTTLKRVKREIIPKRHVLAQLQIESAIVQSQLNSMNF